jgi:hypothetical protein
LLQKETVEVTYNYDSYVQELQSPMQACYKVAKTNLNTKKERSEEYYDRNINAPLFAVGEVLLHDERIRRGRSTKLSLPFIGPYEILAVEDINVTLKLPRNTVLRVHCNSLRPFFG